MLLYEKVVNGVKHIYGTLGKIPSDADQPVIYKDNNGNVLTDVTYSDRFRDDKQQGMNRESDGKNVTVWIGNTMVVPPKGEVGPATVSITFTTPPTKTAYIAGEAINMAGAVVTATYEDETTADVTSQCAFSPAVAAAGVTEVTAKYNNKTATTPITVTVPVVLQSIAFTAEPTTRVYTEGDPISTAGAVVTAYYSDSTTAVVTDDCVFTPANGSASVLGTTALTATYQGKSASVAIIVNERPAVEYHLYYGATDDVPTSVTGLTSVVKTATALINNGFSTELTTNDQYAVVGVDNGLNVKLTKFEQSGYELEFTEVAAGEQTLYYIDKSTQTATVSFTFAAK